MKIEQIKIIKLFSTIQSGDDTAIILSKISADQYRHHFDIIATELKIAVDKFGLNGTTLGTELLSRWLEAHENI